MLVDEPLEDLTVTEISQSSGPSETSWTIGDGLCDDIPEPTDGPDLP
jgi:hypothetical protein